MYSRNVKIFNLTALKFLGAFFFSKVWPGVPETPGHQTETGTNPFKSVHHWIVKCYQPYFYFFSFTSKHFKYTTL